MARPDAELRIAAPNSSEIRVRLSSAGCQVVWETPSMEPRKWSHLATGFNLALENMSAIQKLPVPVLDIKYVPGDLSRHFSQCIQSEGIVSAQLAPELQAVFPGMESPSGAHVELFIPDRDLYKNFVGSTVAGLFFLSQRGLPQDQLLERKSLTLAAAIKPYAHAAQ